MAIQTEGHPPRPRPFLVTGATGNVGSAVVEALLARGLPVRAADRQPERVRERWGERVEAARLDFLRRDTFATASAGVQGVFLLRPPAIASVRTTLCPFVDAALWHGAEHIVFLSVTGAEKNPLVPHHAVEQHLRGSGPRWTLLRAGFFAQNLADAYRRDIAEDGRLFVPAGQGRAAFVDVRDVGEVAAMVLADPEPYRGRAYALTGPEALSFAQVASLLQKALGRSIRYEPATAAGYVRHLRRRGLPLVQALVQAALHVGLRFGQAEKIEPDLRELLGKPPRPLREYIQDHLALWQADQRAPAARAA